MSLTNNFLLNIYMKLGVDSLGNLLDGLYAIFFFIFVHLQLDQPISLSAITLSTFLTFNSLYFPLSPPFTSHYLYLASKNFFDET